ncbi:MAG: biotin transporter BioY [Lachnospiraceae bacterium]|nr:biotin transporter BioY [Lachnospiraceae bacterium]
MSEIQTKEQNRSQGSKVADTCRIGLFTALICVISQLPGIPLPGGVPMTLQTLILPLAGIILGPVNGTIASLIYLLLGIVGLPVFSGFKGGFGVLMGATGGFIISFPLLPLFAGLGLKIGAKKQGEKGVFYYVSLTVGLVLGAVLNYVVGTFWFAGVYLGGITAENLGKGFAACVLPFIPTAIIKIILALLLGTLLRRTLKKASLL